MYRLLTAPRTDQVRRRVDQLGGSGKYFDGASGGAGGRRDCGAASEVGRTSGSRGGAPKARQPRRTSSANFWLHALRSGNCRMRSSFSTNCHILRRESYPSWRCASALQTGSGTRSKRSRCRGEIFSRRTGIPGRGCNVTDGSGRTFAGSIARVMRKRCKIKRERNQKFRHGKVQADACTRSRAEREIGIAWAGRGIFRREAFRPKNIRSCHHLGWRCVM